MGDRGGKITGAISLTMPEGSHLRGCGTVCPHTLSIIDIAVVSE